MPITAYPDEMIDGKPVTLTSSARFKAMRPSNMAPKCGDWVLYARMVGSYNRNKPQPPTTMMCMDSLPYRKQPSGLFSQPSGPILAASSARTSIFFPFFFFFFYGPITFKKAFIFHFMEWGQSYLSDRMIHPCKAPASHSWPETKPPTDLPNSDPDISFCGVK